MVINIDLQGRRGGLPPWALYVPGAMFVMFGLLIILLPNLLQYLIGGALIALGIGLLSVPGRMRR